MKAVAMIKNRMITPIVQVSLSLKDEKYMPRPTWQ